MKFRILSEFRLFFGRIRDKIICLRDLLTFSKAKINHFSNLDLKNNYLLSQYKNEKWVILNFSHRFCVTVCWKSSATEILEFLQTIQPITAQVNIEKFCHWLRYF